MNCKDNRDLKQLPLKFINLLMKNGDKLKAYSIFYNCLKIFYFNFNNDVKTKKLNNSYQSSNMNNENKLIYNFSLIDAKKLLFKSLDLIKPSVDVKTVKVSGRTYLVPNIISKNKQQKLAIRWIIEAARKRKTKLSFSEKLASELLETFHKSGKAIEKRNNMHKLAESNRASLRFKWW